MTGVKQSDCDEDDCTNPLLPSASKTESHRSSSSSSYASASVKDKYATIIHNTTAFSKRKQFIILLIMVIILVYFNSSVTIWDKRNIEKIPVYHRSHVPGMKDETATKISQLSKSMIKKKINNINNIDSSISDIDDGIVINNNNKMKSLHPMNSDINGNSNNNNNDINNIFQKNTNTIIPTINNFNNNNLLRNPTKTIDNNNNNIITKKLKTTNDIKLSSYIMKSTILNRIMTKTTTILPLSSQTSLQSVPLLFAQKLSSLPSSKLLLSSSMITKKTTPDTTINTSTTSTTNNTTTNPLIIIKTSTTTIPSSTTQNSNNSIKLILPPGYLVWSDKCKMPNMDPFNPEIMKYFKRQTYKPCTTEIPHTFISFNDTSKKYILHLNDKIITKYTKGGAKLSCFYQDIERSGTGKNSDRNYKLGKKIDLPKTTELPNTIEFILVTCKSTNNQIYMNVHSMIPEKDEVRIRLNEWKKKYNETGKKPISILFIGIDSISRLNLIRAMPKTAQYVYDNEWFELSGYNKIDDNTFPNLMAILAGLNESHAYLRYNPKKVGLFDKCPLLWKEFQRLGYVTAYAEDETSISTFNYLKNGFIKQPTDYYLRPSLMVAEKKLPTKMKNGLTFCVGYKHSADYILDYAYELGNRYKDDPYFGFFWMNTFSHNAISDSSSMDDRIVEYFKKFSDSGILNRSVIIFISDHGMRFGPTRVLESGYYEERLPLAFLWLPPWLKDIHPEFVNSLNINKNRLTNPYDMHMTLKHILQLSGRIDNVTLAEDCENCQTLFRPVPENRSCQDISIADHWCTCLPFQSVHKDSVIVKRAANYSINYINDYLHNFQNGSIIHLCAKLHLHKIKSANRAITTTGKKKSNNKKMKTIETYQIIMTAKPGDGLFESSVRYHPDSDEFEMTGSISRLNWYGGDSKCLQDSGAKKYCYCIYSSNNNNNSNKNKIKNKNKINKSKNNKTSHSSTSG